MALELLWRIFLLTNPSPVALSVTAGVGGWSVPISMSTMRVAAPLCQFINRALTYASIALAKTFIMVLYSTRTGPLIGGCLGGAF